jgi:hypothetical protein
MFGLIAVWIDTGTDLRYNSLTLTHEEFQMFDWFCNMFTNDDLRELLSLAHEERYGDPLFLADAGRCTLAARLEEVGVSRRLFNEFTRQ